VTTALLAMVVALGGLIAVPASAAAPSARTGPAATGGSDCDALDEQKCLFPFPNDFFTVRDRSTPTGLRVNFQVGAMPVNQAGVPIDPAEWNRNDGFSPGSPILTFVPGLDLERSGIPDQTAIKQSLRRDAPIVLLDADTGKRVPFFAELDASVPTDTERSLIIRPAVNFREGHRIVVALRGLEDTEGAAIRPSALFRAYRDDRRTGDPAHERRREHMEEAVFGPLEEHGVERDDLFLAWDFTVASERGLSERLLHIRDDAFASLEGAAPTFQVTQVENDVDDQIARRVTGTFTVPNYLTGDGSPGNTFQYSGDELPRRNGDVQAPFLCNISRSTLPADGPANADRPVVYGHGLLGSEREVNAGNVRAMANEWGFVFCATKWAGMSQDDIPNAIQVLQDLSKFPSIADRLQQGVLNTLFLGRLMVHEDGLVSDPAFQGASGEPVIDRSELFYDGNSQGGIMGGVATAVAQDWKRAVLGVPAMNYSNLLQRSVDWDTYKAVLEPAYPDAVDRTLAITLVQMLWDRGEANGYAQHLTRAPYRETPRHTVLLHVAFGDHQVANVATEIQARTIGARAHRPALAAGRTPDRPQLWGIPAIERYPYRGSAIVYWDSGTPTPPVGNTAPREGEDSHEDPRAFPAAREQKHEFLRTNGVVVDVCDGRPCTAPPAG
jgi:hypothetical protein